MGSVEIPKWLKGLPLAPEYHPTDTEFADPIAYISKIEKEASAFGICKVIPPLPKPAKRYVIGNLNKSLSKCPELGSGANSGNPCSSSGSGSDGNSAVFTTRHQELGQSGKRVRGAGQPFPSVHKQVWQSGEVYTLEEFEAKAKLFTRTQLGTMKEVSPLIIESMFWKASSEKPIYVEYANDVPGSGFGEPHGSFRYFHKRRKESFRKSYGMHTDQNKETSSKDDSRISDIRSSSKVLDKTSRLSKQNGLNSCKEMEGTAGWKLSNSPWNLQVIARSPGSLTRFMPDDIPGVTSPMVYIGMLFSWFAWHVEDHELHSLNFLHTGSPKTWYAVPGDYAFTFEEVIRNQAYGGNIDRLAALTLLGEKTTLLSPEVVVDSGLPCCRLIQNPGEFVVTFPRAYHVGFSHGFSCGEAANFGTPEWLKVAKDAAVRRAAMNYLPMLSHQQLLYLLTMSFTSRVPRYLLPGARSSRLRDRLKEERELLVKKAFIDDILDENNLLSILLKKESSYRAVAWNPESLPSPSKGSSQFQHEVPQNIKQNHIEKGEDNKGNLYEEMSLYMETMNDLYPDSSDLSCDFQVDTGMLACVACGILGFPFMVLIQPSERAAMQIMSADCVPHLNSHSFDDTVKGSSQDDRCVLPGLPTCTKNLPMPSSTMFDKQWTASNGFLKPRIFCLEHAVQIEELLQPKGGANVLVICHSDYLKMKVQTAAIAEEINSRFIYTEIPLENAAREDLNLINLAIEDEDEDHDKCRDDWTSKLGINLRYCVKLGKLSSSNQVEHALTLGGLSEKNPISDFSNINWRLRRFRSKRESTRSKRELTHAVDPKPDDEGITVRKEKKLLQYSRKIFKSKAKKEVQGILNVDENSRNTSENYSVEKGLFSFLENSVSQTDNRGLGEISPHAEDVEAVHTENESKILEESNVNEKGDVLTWVSSEMKHEIKGDREINAGIRNFDRLEMQGENQGMEEIAKRVCTWSDSQNLEESNVNEKECDDLKLVSSDKQHEIEVMEDTKAEGEAQCEGTNTMDEDRDPISTENDDECVMNMVSVVDKSCIGGEVCDRKSLDQETQTENGDIENGSLLDDANWATEERSEIVVDPSPKASKRKGKRKWDPDQKTEQEHIYSGFMRSPCEGLRPRGSGFQSAKTDDECRAPKKKENRKRSGSGSIKKGDEKLAVKKRKKEKNTKESQASNRCPHRGCGKLFSSYKSMVAHQRVHSDERPLMCPWKGCTVSFKWAWARTEHLRVHTGERPYHCSIDGCGLKFRFVSDFNRHRRKTGHYANPPS